MTARLVAWSTRRSALVLAASVLVAAACYLAQRTLPRDVIPDLSSPQIVLVAEWMGRSATEVDARVGKVLTAALAGVPGAAEIRGSSMTGMTYVDVLFESEGDVRRGRAEIVARVNRLRPRLPPGVRVIVGPEASSTGWVLQYALLAPSLRGGTMGTHGGRPTFTLQKLRKLQDQVFRPALAAVPGVAEIASFGGETDEILIETSPGQLGAAGAALSDVLSAASLAFSGEGRPESVDQIGAIPLQVPGSDEPVPLETVARVKAAAEMANGIADLNGVVQVAGGIVIASRDADVLAVIRHAKEVIARLRVHLPPDVHPVILYDRSQLISRVEETLGRALAEEVIVVALVVLLFLLHGRSALVPIITLPLVVLLTLALMRLFGTAATIMSVGGIGIALGMAVDADLVALEACHRHLEGARRDRRARLVAAAGSFAPAILTSLVIAGLTFLPVLAFSGETGRLLRPLALTKTLVIFAAALVTVTVAPALRDRLLRGRIRPELGNPVTRALIRVYRPFVHFALRRPVFTLVTAGLLALSCLPIAWRLGSEFLPRVDEGDLLFMPTTSPGIPPGEAMMQLERQDRALRNHPAVANVFGKVGRADSATDPAPFSMIETTIALRPRSEWPLVGRPRWHSGWAPEPLGRALRLLWPERSPMTMAELIEDLDRLTRLPGWTNAWTTPIRARMDMMATGVRTPVGVRIVSDDIRRLDALGAKVRDLLTGVPGTKSAFYESSGQETRLAFAPDPAALARHEVALAAVRSAADLLVSGGQVGEIARDGSPARVRVTLAAPWLPKPPQDLLREATVRSTSDFGAQPVPLGLLGRPVFETVPAMLRTERGESVGYIYVDLTEGTDVGSYVRRARQALARAEEERTLSLSGGERLEWTGQYQLLAAGERRLRIIVPIVAVLMLGLLFLQFRSVIQAAIVLASVPFALVGSIWTLHLLDYQLSAPVWVGLLSVVGLAMQTGVLMVVYIDDAFHRRVREGRMRSRHDLIEAHAEGTVQRLRPKLMTIITMTAGLLPLLWAQGAGAEIMRRVAAPMIGGLLTSAFLTLEVIPVLYTIWRTRQLRAAARRGIPVAEVVGANPGWARGSTT